MPLDSLVGNRIINIIVIVCNLNKVVLGCSEECNENSTRSDFPSNWPSHWDNGRIPFVYNFFSMARNHNRLTSLVKTAHEYLETRSCLIFEEHDPRIVGQLTNFTYIYYVFSGALESCCLTFFKKPVGRRMVLITPLCTMPGEITHATLHGMGVTHDRYEPFNEVIVKSVLFPVECKGKSEKLRAYFTNQ